MQRVKQDINDYEIYEADDKGPTLLHNN